MGIADRGYMHAGGNGGRSMGPRSGRWTITTWVIVLCCGVWFVDGFFPSSLVRTDLKWDTAAGSAESQAWVVVDSWPSVANGQVVKGAPRSLEDPPQGRRPDYLVLAPVDAPQGGQAVYRRFHPIERWLHFSTMEGFLRLEWWRLLGFQFLHSHAGITHLLFNCIGLFFFGPLVERYLGRKRFLAFYLLCGMFGALAFTTLNIGGIVAESWGFDRVPGLLFNDPGTPLVGASAGVFGVILAGAFLQPNARVVVWFFFPMRLKTMAYGLVALAIFTILRDGPNAGGEAGHLGGALAGAYFIRRPHHLHGFFDFLGKVDPTSERFRFRAAKAKAKIASNRGRANDEEVDRILDKISQKGLHSLSPKEKETLNRASKDRQ